MRSNVGRSLLLSALLLTASLCPARGDTLAPPRTYKTVTADGKYVFVALAPTFLPGMPPHPADVAIRSIYKESGLYRNDGSGDPLWTMPAGWYANRVFPATDGKHLVVPGGPASSAALTTSPTVSFYSSGVLVRTYTLGEPVSRPEMLSQTASYVHWHLGDNFDDPNLRYSLQLKDGNSYVFDISTGTIVSSYRPWRTLSFALGGACMLIFVLAFCVLMYFLFRKQPDSSTNQAPA